MRNLVHLKMLRIFQKYRKLQNTIAIVEKQKELSEAELSYLESIVYELEEVSTIEDIDNIYSEICDNLIFGKMQIQ